MSCGPIEYIKNQNEYVPGKEPPHWVGAEILHWNTDGTVCLRVPGAQSYIVAPQWLLRDTRKTLTEIFSK